MPLPTTVILEAVDRADGRWYISSPTLPGFRYILHPDDDMAMALRMMWNITAEAANDKP